MWHCKNSSGSLKSNSKNLVSLYNSLCKLANTVIPSWAVATVIADIAEAADWAEYTLSVSAPGASASSLLGESPRAYTLSWEKFCSYLKYKVARHTVSSLANVVHLILLNCSDFFFAIILSPNQIKSNFVLRISTSFTVFPVLIEDLTWAYLGFLGTFFCNNYILFSSKFTFLSPNFAPMDLSISFLYLYYYSS